jgi:hypothetical protein
MKIRLLSAIFACILFGAALSGPASAQEAHVSGVVLTKQRNTLILYFSVEDCFTEEMKQAISSGLETSFTFFVSFYEKRNFWWDRKVADLEFSHSIKYDNLKKEYEVRFEERKGQSVRVKDFNRAMELMSNVEALELIHLTELTKGKQYEIQLMAELDKIRLPFHLHYVFIFLSLWDFETDWTTIDFLYK